METLVENWKTKLHPARFSQMSGKMAAIVAFVLDETFTNPAINDIVVTSDGFVLAQNVGDVGNNDFFGAESDLNANWSRLLDAAELTADERTAAVEAFASHIRRV